MIVSYPDVYSMCGQSRAEIKNPFGPKAFLANYKSFDSHNAVPCIPEHPQMAPKPKTQCASLSMFNP
jgi:hypothetical protein